MGAPQPLPARPAGLPRQRPGRAGAAEPRRAVRGGVRARGAARRREPARPRARRARDRRRDLRRRARRGRRSDVVDRAAARVLPRVARGATTSSSAPPSWRSPAQALGDPRAGDWLAASAGWARAYLANGGRRTRLTSTTRARSRTPTSSARSATAGSSPRWPRRAGAVGDLRAQLGGGVRRAPRDPFRAGVIYDDFDAASHAFGLVATAALTGGSPATAASTRFATAQRDWLARRQRLGRVAGDRRRHRFPRCPQHVVAEPLGRPRRPPPAPARRGRQRAQRSLAVRRRARRVLRRGPHLPVRAAATATGVHRPRQPLRRRRAGRGRRSSRRSTSPPTAALAFALTRVARPQSAACEHLPRDRRGGLAARARADEHHRDGDLRRAGGGEGDEPRVGVLRVLRAASAVGRSSAVPVLPATSTPGSAAAVPVPRARRRASCRAPARRRARETARWRTTRSERTIRGVGWTPRLAIVAPTAAICSGVARSRSWPIAAAPTASASLRSLREDARLGRRDARRLVEAEALRRGVACRLRAELRAERGEHRVARVREGLGERAAAGLVARVAQLDPRQRRRGAHRIGARGRGDLRLQRGGQRDDLERRAGRLGRGDGEAAEREHRAVARAHHGDAAEPVAERRDRRALEAGPDRRAHGAPAPRLRARRCGARRSAARRRPAAEAVVVARLEAEARVALRGRAAGDRRAVGSRSSRRPSAASTEARWGARGSAAARARPGAGRAAAGTGASAPRRARRPASPAARRGRAACRTARAHGDRHRDLAPGPPLAPAGSAPFSTVASALAVR